MTDILPAPTAQKTGDDDTLVHEVCPCSRERALCGKSLPVGEYELVGFDDDDLVCVVCEDIHWCPNCKALVI